MVHPICPLCGIPLTTATPVWHCAAGHSFDVAKQGYVNLLPVQQKHSLHPGDPASQVHARRRFLGATHYSRIAQAVCALLPNASTILDVGCGEGYYLRQLAAQLPFAERWGVDISRDAVRLAAGADKAGQYLVATAAQLPFPAGSFDALLSLFALTVPDEFRRVLRPGGWYLQALAEEDHLSALKSLIYPTLTHREKVLTPTLTGFALCAQQSVQFELTLSTGQEVQDLLAMTPHFWRITQDGAARAAEATELRDSAHIRLNLYRAIDS